MKRVLVASLLVSCLFAPRGFGDSNSLLSRLPVVFEPDRGGSAFVAHGPGMAVHLRENAIVFAMGRQDTVRLELAGAAARPSLVGIEPLSGRSNYFIGNDPKTWRTDVPQYRRVKYRDIYPGIDLVVYGSGGTFEYDFDVAPGADPAAIRFRLTGAERVRINESGDLVSSGDFGSITHRKPRVFAQRGSAPRQIRARYAQHHGLWSFDLGHYEKSERLVIDPVVVASTYLGGTDTEWPYAMTLDSAGNIYLTGTTISTNFPLQNPYQTNQTSVDVFVTKLDPTASRLIYSTYLGGRLSQPRGFNEAGRAIAVDASGNAYVAGETGECEFPTTPGAFQTQCQPIVGSDAFVTKLGPAGNFLVFSTYIHGLTAGEEDPTAIALDGGGRVYVAGYTDVLNFPVTAGAYQTTFAGGSLDGFVAVLNANATKLEYATYLGGSSFEYVRGMAVDDQGAVWVAGETASSDFPVKNAYQSNYGGSDDAFVARFNPVLSSLEYSTFLGGSGIDVGSALARDPAGNFVVAGYTSSTNFPLAHPLQSKLGGKTDVFVTKLNRAGAALVYSTYVGGRESDGVLERVSLAVDGAGNAYISGSTTSPDFPLVNAVQRRAGGKSDAFLTKITADGSGIVYSTFLGGSADEGGRAVAVSPLSKVYVCGNTLSSDFPVVAALQPRPAQEPFGITSDLFLVVIDDSAVRRRAVNH